MPELADMPAPCKRVANGAARIAFRHHIYASESIVTIQLLVCFVSFLASFIYFVLVIEGP